MLRWYQNLYLGESVKEYRKTIVRRAKAGKQQDNIFLITLPANPENLLDIYPSRVLENRYFRTADKLVLGLAMGRDEAAETAGAILWEVYEQTGSFATSCFFQQSKE